MTAEHSPRLPVGWARSTLGEVALLNPRCFSSPPKDEDLVTFVPMAAVEAGNGKIDPSVRRPWREVRKGYTSFQEGDLLFAKITPCMENGKIALARGLHRGRGAGSTEFHVLRARSGVSRGFLLYFLSQEAVRRQAKAVMKGAAGQLRVPPEFLEDAVLDVPPATEQERIVEAIEAQLIQLEASVTALRRAQASLKRYRAAVLRAACEGRLVPTEAELAQAEGRDYEPASRLLERILGERRGSSGIEKSTGSPGREVPDNRPQETQEFNRGSRVASGDMPEIPVGWTWTSVAQLASQDANAITDGPFGSNLKTAHYTAHGPRVIRLQNISDGAFVDLHSHISEEHFNRLGRHRVEAGDIVIAALGERLPRACVVPEFLGPAIVKADCVRFKPDFRLVYPRYASLILNAQPTRTRTQEIIHGVGRPRLNVREIKAIMIPLAPFPEQARIVSEVERRFSVIDELGATIEASLKRAERLKQSILKRAFEGKLVPQDPKDEPASVLLERIKAERASRETEVRGSRTRKPRQGRFRRKMRRPSGKPDRS